MNAHDELPAMSRSGSTSSLGKLTCRLDIPVSQDLEDAVTTMATLARMPKAEFARRLLEEAIFGRLSMVRRLSGFDQPGQSDESPRGV